jgi:hypothetical protein
VLEYWKEKLAEKRPRLQYSCPNYGDHIQDLEISNDDRLKFIFE